jgi:carboxyl-terminal processing protease
MFPRLVGSLAFIALLLGFQDAQAGKDFDTLHEVIRHFQVAFVDRPNLGALLTGALQGVKKAAPKTEIRILPHPDLYEVKVGAKSIRITKDAVRSYKQLEQALVRVGCLVAGQKLAKSHRSLEHAMIRGMVMNCGDPWSVFLEGDLYNRLLDDGSGKTGDAGLLVEPHGQGLRVLDVTPESPAAKAGIRVGDPVSKIAGRPAEQLNELEALALMRGPIGGKVTVVAAGKRHNLELAPPPKRNIAVDPPVDGVARVQLMNFQAGTGRRLAGVMKKLSGMGLKKLILDLRGNPGGLVTEGTEVAGLFIRGGKVVSVVSRKHMRTEVEESPRPGPYRKLPLVILVDHRSASVSEIVVMALKDYQRARIVGEKTLGKGTVQVVMELMDGSALKLSTGRYYSPRGTPLYEGIEPDVEVEWDGQGSDPQLQRARMILKK